MRRVERRLLDVVASAANARVTIHVLMIDGQSFLDLARHVASTRPHLVTPKCVELMGPRGPFKVLPL